MLTNGNGHLSLSTSVSPSNPAEAATILKVYYNDLLSQADKELEQLEAELAKARAKRDAVKELADQAASMLQGIENLQKIGMDAEKVSLSPSPASVSCPDLSDDTELGTENFYLAAEDTVEEQALVISEDDIPPTAKIIINDDGTVEAEMLPRFEGMKRNEAIALILEENSDRILHRSSIAQEMFGHIEDKDARRIVVGRVGAALTSGKGKGLWFSDPRNEGFYTCNRDLIKGNKKAPR